MRKDIKGTSESQVKIINTNYNIRKNRLIRGTEQQKQNAKEDNTIVVEM